MDPDFLKSLIEFANSDNIEITSENVQSLISTAKYLQLTQIQIHDACLEFLGKILCLNNVWEIRLVAVKHCCSEMIGLADSYIRQNFEAFSKSESFLSLPFEYLKEVLGADDLKVSTETCVFEGVIRWVKDSPSQRKYFLPNLLSVVRLSQLSPEYMTQIISNEELLTSIPWRNFIDDFMTRPRITDAATTYSVSSPHCTQSVNTLDLESEKWMNLSTSKNQVTIQVHRLTDQDKKGCDLNDPATTSSAELSFTTCAASTPASTNTVASKETGSLSFSSGLFSGKAKPIATTTTDENAFSLLTSKTTEQETVLRFAPCTPNTLPSTNTVASEVPGYLSYGDGTLSSNATSVGTTTFTESAAAILAPKIAASEILPEFTTRIPSARVSDNIVASKQVESVSFDISFVSGNTQPFATATGSERTFTSNKVVLEITPGFISSEASIPASTITLSSKEAGIHNSRPSASTGSDSSFSSEAGSSVKYSESASFTSGTLDSTDVIPSDSTSDQNISPSKERSFEEMTGERMAAVRSHRSVDKIIPAALDTITFEREGNQFFHFSCGKLLRFNEKKTCLMYSPMNYVSGQQVVVIQWLLPYSQEVKDGLPGVRKTVDKLAKLQHKNLVRYLGMNWKRTEEGIVVQIFQEYVEGSLLPSLRLLATEELRRISREVLSTLQFLHERSIFHERLRASSIFIDKNGCVRLSDYSIDQRLHEMSSLPIVQTIHSSRKQHDMYCLGNLLRECLAYQGTALRTLPHTKTHLKYFSARCLPLSRTNPDLVAFSGRCLDSETTDTSSASELFAHPFCTTSPPSSEEDDSHRTAKDEKKTLLPVVNNEKHQMTENFIILETLGKGVFGKVFKVRHKIDNMIYAAKCVPLNNVDATQDRAASKEVKTLCILDHKNVVRYHTSFTGNMPDKERGSVSSSLCLWILMECCDKRTLRTVIDEGTLYKSYNGKISPNLTEMYHSILSGLEYVHSKGIIHRDLKPDNIFIDAKRVPKIGDFGLATTVSRRRLFPDVQLQQEFTLGSAFSDLSSVSTSDIPDEYHSGNRGTFIYRAPELQSNADSIRYSKKVDLYSLGIILFEMCHAPLPTLLERVQTIQNLRTAEICHESDLAPFTSEQNVRIVLCSLLEKDPCRRKGLRLS